MGDEIRKLEALLKMQRDAVSRREMLGKIREWRRKEDILWLQRARTDYLKYDDSNTRWFHSRASMRWASNSIEQLMGEDGVMHSAPEEIDNIVVDYFTNLFSSFGNLVMDDVLDGIHPRVLEALNEGLCAPYTRGAVEVALK